MSADKQSVISKNGQRMRGTDLSTAAVKWATPTGEDAKNTAGPGQEKRHGPALNVQVDKWPTPTGDDANNVTRASGDFQSLSREVEGSLNPDWVEQHLMSLPEGWTRLEPVPDGAYDEWFGAMRDGTWWDTERGLPRVTTGAENRVNRLKMLGNGIVPASGALAVRDMMSWCWGTIDPGVTQEEAKRRGT